ncbi:hypothetical protein LSUCC0387_05435 [Rhodobacterales bacterium LSUCC0387]|nr:hypothetical protein [Rhodobacterales bacterium LSUCC0387]
MDADYRLYADFFDHKGPMYYAFLKVIGLIIGFGAPQAVFSLALTAFIFFCSLIALVSRKPKALAVTVLVIAALALAHQPTNASIALFLASQLLLGYYFSRKYLAAGRLVDAILAGVFFTSAALTRVDAVAYLPWLLAIFLINKYSSVGGGGSVYAVLRAGVVSTFFGGILLAVVVSTMHLTPNEIFVSNVSFNTYYRGVIGGCYYCRDNHFEILVRSGALFAVFYIFIDALKPFPSMVCFKGVYPKFCAGSFTRHTDSIASWAFALIGVVVWVYSGSDKDYHVYLVLLPILVLVIEHGAGSINGRFVLAVCALFLPFSLDFLRAGKRMVLNPECLVTPLCQMSPAASYRDAINVIIDRNIQIIVGGRGWPYVFAQQSPTISVNDWWLYSNNAPFVTPHLQAQFEHILAMGKGSEILIDSSLYYSDTGSPYLDDIRANFEVTSDLDYYLLLSKR